MGKVEATRDVLRPTLDELRALLDRTEGDTVELTVMRTHPPKRGATIRVIAVVGGKLRRGPMSSSDASVVHAGGRNWTTSWRVVDLRRWVKKMDLGR
ncbi:MAG: hypothetical protein KC457_31880 [Myxococcales bacterium]|nr:hypothetical protein [Myxococcales bacterium]